MMDALREAARHVEAVVVTRGKIRGARLGKQRVVLQVAILKGDVKEGVELLLPYGKGFAAAFLLAVTSYGGGTRAQIPTARSPITNTGVGD